MPCKEFLKPAVSNNVTAKLPSTLNTPILIHVLIEVEIFHSNSFLK